MFQKTQSTSLPLAIEYASPSHLKFNPKNARSHKPPQIAAIARSIQTFGFNVPVVTDEEGQILAGHGRVTGTEPIHAATHQTFAELEAERGATKE